MKKSEKIKWLCSNHPDEYYVARNKTIDELDEVTPMFCFCGKLATGLHTDHCRSFQSKVDSGVINKLKHLIPI